MAEVKPEIETVAKIKVIGVGGGGGSALGRMIAKKLKGVEFVAVNTDIQALQQNPAENKISIGKTVTRGLGAGMNPEMGKKAAEESANDIRNIISGADMIFLTGGLGGGTGSGALPEIAKIAKDSGVLTVAVVTKPFTFEGAQRKRIAEEAYQKLSQHVDTIITIPNDRILQIIDKKTSMVEAFDIVDDVLRQGVQGIADVITIPGMINVDFADVKAVVQDAGSALMGIGTASGESRAVEAAKMAIASPLLEISIDGAKGILLAIAGPLDLGMHEVTEAAKVITGSADEDVKVIFGAYVDETLGDEIKITVVATGFEGREKRRSPSLAGDVQVMPQSSWNSAQQREEKSYGNYEREEERRDVSPFGKKPVRERRIDEGDDFSNEEKPSRGGIFSMRRVQSERSEPPVREDNDYKQVDDDFEDDDRPVRKMNEPVNRNQSMNKDNDDDDDDFGMPAFIRRKMM